MTCQNCKTVVGVRIIRSLVKVNSKPLFIVYENENWKARIYFSKKTKKWVLDYK